MTRLLYCHYAADVFQEYFGILGEVPSFQFTVGKPCIDPNIHWKQMLSNIEIVLAAKQLALELLFLETFYNKPCFDFVCKDGVLNNVDIRYTS